MARALGIAALALIILGGGIWLALLPEPKPHTSVEEVDAAAKPVAEAQPPAPVETQSARVAAVPTATATPAPAVPMQAQRSWFAIYGDVRNLRSDDQTGLDELYRRSRDLIESAPAESQKAMEKELTSWISTDGAQLEEGFFALSAWIRNSRTPSRALEALWERDPGADAEAQDPHHTSLSPAVRYERAQAYAARELRKQILEGKEIGSGERTRLVSELTGRATREKSLDVSLELFQLLKTLGQKDAIETALKGHSERDQKLIRGVLSAQETAH